MDKEKVQGKLLDMLVSNEGQVLCNLYYRGSLFRMERSVSLERMHCLLGISGMRINGLWLYRQGQKNTVPAVDRWLQRNYDQYRDGLLITSEAEQNILQFVRSSAYIFERNCRAK